MNVYEPASPFILQGLPQGTMYTQGHTCVGPNLMCTHRRLTFQTKIYGPLFDFTTHLVCAVRLGQTQLFQAENFGS